MRRRMCFLKGAVQLSWRDGLEASFLLAPAEKEIIASPVLQVHRHHVVAACRSPIPPLACLFSFFLSEEADESDATEEEATGGRTTRVGRPRGGMKVAARIGEGLRREIEKGKKGRRNPAGPVALRRGPVWPCAWPWVSPGQLRRPLYYLTCLLKHLSTG